MRASRESAFDRLLHELGGILGEHETGRRDRKRGRMSSDLQRGATAWLLGRTLRPGHVNWPRLLAATAAGLVLGDVLETLAPRRGAGAMREELEGEQEGEGEGGERETDTRHERGAALLRRAGGDLAVAATYASVVYHRLPGPGWFRGALFGAADILVAGRGGLAALIADFSPRGRPPLARLLPDEEPRLARAFALSIALAALYRDER